MTPESKLAEFYPEHYFLLTKRTTRLDGQIAFHLLEGFPKFRSVAAFRAAGLNTSDMIFIERLTPGAKNALEQFILYRNLDRVLIRSEKLGGGLGSPSKQGVLVESIALEVNQLLESKRSLLVAVQAAGNIYRNSYNINWCLGGTVCRDTIEVTGPGFTASDLNRYGILHEGFSIPSFIDHLCANLIDRYYLVAQDIYTKNRQAKLDKYGISQMRQEGSPLIDQEYYQPIPVPLLQDVWNQRHVILHVIEQLGYIERGAIVSLSFLPTSQDTLQIHCWDVHQL